MTANASSAASSAPATSARVPGRVRTRFAPSPTGFLHIGGVRTALYAWAFAKHHGGDYVLRIEDTDVERSTPEAVAAILEGLDWLGLGLVDPSSVGGDSPVSLAGQGARMNSETAGSIIDRMSIMALKVRAMKAQTERTDVDEAHREASRARLARLETQRDDLGRCLDELMADCRAGKAYFKVYRQFKMYNDPAFNPALVAERGA